MLRFKDLMERVNDTRSLYLEQDNKLIKAKDIGSYPAHHDHITHDTYGDAGDEATSAHHKFASERAPVHTFKHLGSTHKIYHHPNGSTIHTMEHTHGHHGDDIAVYSGHHDPKHIENQEKKHSNMNEELEELDEANENFDSNSKAHQAAKKAVKGWRGLSKATYHSDGSATINTKERTKNRYGKEGHYSGLETTHSHSVVDQHLKYAGGMHNHSRDELDNHHQKIDGLHWKVKGKATSYGGTHEIHIHEEVDGLHEISAMKAIRTSVKREVSGVNKSMETGDSDDAGQKKIDKNKERIHKKYGYRAANLAHRAAGKKLDIVDGPYRPKPSTRNEEFDFDLFESIMLGEGDLSIRTLYNKYADHALGAGDSPQPKKAAAVKKAITKVHGSTVMGHLEKAKNAAAKNDQDSESRHFNAARNSAKTDTIGATVGKGRSSMRKEEVDLDESRMKDLAMDMESLSHADFKRKHRRTKQEMQDSLKSVELKGNQHKIDANKNGKVDGHDFKILRNAKKARYQ